MGFCVSLYAIFDREPSDVHRDLGLEPNGETEDFPDSPVSGAMMKSGVYILYFNDRAMFGEDAIRPINANSRLLGCNVNETCMYSSLTAINHGSEEWSVIHDSSNGVLNLETHGDVPAPFTSIRDDKLSKQEHDGDGVDHVFDVPVDLFVRLGGIRYDEDLESDDPNPWHTLVSTKKPSRWWWPFSKKA